MGFFGALGKIMAGKPVYEPGDVKPAEQQQAAVLGGKTMPVVRIGRVESRPSGQRLDVYADLHNDSSEAIFIDRVFVLGVKREIDDALRPGQSKQFMVYSGPLLMQEPRGYAEVQYRKQSDNDYFANYHQLRSRQEGNHGYSITECRLQGPVKDI